MTGILLSAILVGLTGCYSTPARISASGDRGRYHLVRKGETLYSIAWRHGTDYRTLARINHIRPPYTIYAGQKLRIGPRIPVRARAKPVVPTRKKTSPARPVSPAVSNIEWRWPVRGEIIKPFSLDGKINKGIDIAGKSGAPVRAAAGGVVVYAGGNLRGYGKLVIVKHDDHYLSAYGNNRSIRVREGEKVSAGQIIGEVGISSANVAMLHFEIRRDGKPVNPVRFLPE